MDYEDLLVSLTQLSRVQLEAVRQRTAVLLQLKTGTGITVEETDWLLAGILTELRRRGLDARDNFRIRSSSAFAGFQTQSQSVRALLERVAPDLTMVQKRALGEVAAYELARLITWTSPSREVMLMNIARAPEAIDRAYPGYLEAGLIHLVIRSALSNAV